VHAEAVSSRVVGRINLDVEVDTPPAGPETPGESSGALVGLFHRKVSEVGLDVNLNRS